mgnify:CR=1 FL=1
MNQDLIRERTKRFIGELDIPISKFANKIGFSRELYYRWIKGDFDFSNEKVSKIDDYLRKYGF